MGAGEAQAGRESRRPIGRPAEEKAHSVLQDVEASSVKRKAAQVAGSFQWKPKSQDGGSTRRVSHRKGRQLEGLKPLAPGRDPQGCRKENRKLPL